MVTLLQSLRPINMKNKLKHTNKIRKNITVDTSLDKYSGKILFEGKVNAMKELLSSCPIPTELKS
ncbi:MAG: hypothetical protein K0S32_2623 [Bacteroidetes bacterium]|nr:hypothetical protein [Bacteroidota bacterium]